MQNSYQNLMVFYRLVNLAPIIEIKSLVMTYSFADLANKNFA